MDEHNANGLIGHEYGFLIFSERGDALRGHFGTPLAGPTQLPFGALPISLNGVGSRVTTEDEPAKLVTAAAACELVRFPPIADVSVVSAFDPFRTLAGGTSQRLGLAEPNGLSDLRFSGSIRSKGQVLDAPCKTGQIVGALSQRLSFFFGPQSSMGASSSHTAANSTAAASSAAWNS